MIKGNAQKYFHDSKNTIPVNRNRSAETKVRGPWRHVLRAGWLILAFLMVGLWIAGTLSLIRDSFPDCIEIPCDNIDITIGDLEAADDIGVSPGLTGTAARVLGSLSILSSIFYFVIAGIIFWRMSDDWLGMLVSITLVFLGGLFFTSSNDALIRAFPDIKELHDLIQLSGVIALTAIFLLFPDGQFVPRWFRWFFGIVVALFLLNEFMSAAGVASDPLEILTFLVLIFIAPANQIYRYIRVSTPVAQQQTKWVVLGLFSALVLMITWLVVGAFYPPDQPGSPRLIALLIAVPLISLLGLLLPLTFAISILRYRLWEIDIIINRGLIYGTLTILLALIYFGTVTILQNLFTAVTGQQSPISLVISTLIIAALFQPLYRRVQELINRRFYRGKYDAGKILAEFASTARDEVDLDNITSALVDAVEKTLQPATISLWLKEPSRHSIDPVERGDIE
jgi:hypothetical protein